MSEITNLRELRDRNGDPYWLRELSGQTQISFEGTMWWGVTRHEEAPMPEPPVNAAAMNARMLKAQVMNTLDALMAEYDRQAAALAESERVRTAQGQAILQFQETIRAAGAELARLEGDLAASRQDVEREKEENRELQSANDRLVATRAQQNRIIEAMARDRDEARRLVVEDEALDVMVEGTVIPAAELVFRGQAQRTARKAAIARWRRAGWTPEEAADAP